MPARYIRRTLEGVVRKAAREFPAVVLTGPRQSGKTTLLKHLYGDRHRYVSFDTPDVRAAATADPRGFLDLYPPVILDEIQHAPGLFPYIKERIDADRAAAGRYFLTGSQNVLLMERITESLAGRAAILRLLPLSRKEHAGTPEAPFPWEKLSAAPRKKRPPGTLWEQFLRGGFPELAAYPKRGAELWHASYVQTYLERDVRGIRQVGDLNLFQSFLRAIAARSGQLLNITDIARDIGAAVNTAKSWLSVLETTHQIFLLRPYFANVGKRLVKTPKVYFTDVGTLCYLVGLRDPEHAASGPMRGAIFETAVVSEIVKGFRHRGLEAPLYFWRTSTGAEVDIIVDDGGRLIPIEVKSTATPRPGMASTVRSFRTDIGSRAASGFVIHTGDMRLPLGSEVTALPFSEI